MTRKRSIRLSEAADRYVQDGANALGERKFSEVLSRIVERYSQMIGMNLHGLKTSELREISSIISGNWSMYSIMSLPAILEARPDGKELANKLGERSTVELVALVEAIERGER